MAASYEEFLQSKMKHPTSRGLEEVPPLNPMLFLFQRDAVAWALRKGRAAIWGDCGVGKTAMQIEYAKHVPGNVLIVAPLAVNHQTIQEGERFGIEIINSRDGRRKGKITITNYEMLGKFKAEDYDGIVLDESGILKGLSSTYRHELTRFASRMRWRLACTATPSPNDLVELTNHSEFLGIMTRKEVISLFFIQDGNQAHRFKIKGHARTDFWKFLASWAIAFRTPSDLGYLDDGFILPPLRYEEHILNANKPTPGMLFALEAHTLDERRCARRDSIEDRVAEVASIVNGTPGPWLVWCNLNEESTQATAAIDGAMQVTGSDDLDYKEQTLLDFANGKIRCLVSKPRIAGHGLNLQNCADVVFLGLSDCYDEITEILTPDGWKLFGNLKSKEKVATVNLQTLSFEWQIPTKIIYEPYVGHMLHFHSHDGFDLLVTPNHKLVVDRDAKRYLRDTSGWRLKDAWSIATRFRRQEWRLLSCSTLFNGETPKHIDVPIPKNQRINSRSRLVTSVPARDFMILAGWYITEGYCRPIESSEAGRIAISQSIASTQNRREIVSLLRSLNLHVNDRTKDITAYSFNLAAFLLASFGNSSKSKHIPPWMKNLHSDLLVILRDTMLKGDGCHSNGIAHCYRTISRQLADDFQEICIKTGARASVRERGIISKFGDNPAYDVQFTPRRTRPSIWQKPEIVEYNGMIGCVTVPNHAIIVRRNGIPIVSGNSFEELYQATRRCWRFGQKRPVTVHIVITEAEGAVRKNIARKEKQADEMMRNVVAHMKGLQLDMDKKVKPYRTAVESGSNWTLMLGDSCERIKEIESDTVGLSVWSPPFPGMYAYTDSERDIGNVRDIEELIAHFDFLVDDLLRITMPGRSCCIHLTQEPIFKKDEGYTGMRDFRGMIISQMQRHGWIYASERTIDKDPQLRAQRTKDYGLAMKSAAQDASVLTGTMPDYLLQFRKPGQNLVPIRALIDHQDPKKRNPTGWITREDWIQWASAVWYGYHRIGKGGIRETDVLSARPAKDADDEKHLCPLQLGVIERCVKLWSAPGDLVLDPFAGIGSTGHVAIIEGRRFVGIELKESYWKVACDNLQASEREADQRRNTLFSKLEREKNA